MRINRLSVNGGKIMMKTIRNFVASSVRRLGVMNYDEDFLIMKFTSDGLAGLLNLIPADTQR